MQPRRERNSPCSQTSSRGPLQRSVLNPPPLLISILRSGLVEAYVTHIKFSAQVLLDEHRALWLSVIMGTGSMQRSTLVAGWGNDEKQAMPPVWDASLEQQVLR